MDLVAALTKSQLKTKLPELKPGDRVKVHSRIVEGDRERIQVFQGTVLRLRREKTAQANMTVRRVATHGIGVERTFNLHSPRVEKIEVLGHTHVRRAQLYYLRGRSGKAARLREKRSVEGAPTAETETATTETE
ncbi:MAG: 50S ribosomal protein L19 [Chloroflexi bacterium]|nr:50S ribosomal protein L19 [Chloroflexota bacterium]